MRPLLCAGLLIAQTAAGGEPPFSYPSVRPVPIAQGLSIGKMNLQASYFTTPDALDVVATHFASRWRDEGYPVVVEGEGPGRVVSAYLTREGVQRVVVLSRRGRVTLVLCVERPLGSDPLPVVSEAR